MRSINLNDLEKQLALIQKWNKAHPQEPISQFDKQPVLVSHGVAGSIDTIETSNHRFVPGENDVWYGLDETKADEQFEKLTQGADFLMGVLSWQRVTPTIVGALKKTKAGFAIVVSNEDKPTAVDPIEFQWKGRSFLVFARVTGSNVEPFAVWTWSPITPTIYRDPDFVEAFVSEYFRIAEVNDRSSVEMISS
jgi:hypothetical protein